MDTSVTLRPSIIKTLLLFLISVVFLAIGFWMIQKHELAGWLGVFFFGICTCVSIIILVPNSTYLKLSDEGFEICALYRKSFTKWNEVDCFTVRYIGKSKYVVFNYTDKSRKRARTSQALAGYDAALPDSFGMKVEELADLMNKWKKKVQN